MKSIHQKIPIQNLIQKFGIFWWMLFFAQITQAQILNIEKSKIENDSSQFFTGGLNFSGSFFNRSAAFNNPVNLLGLNANLDLLYNSKKHAFIFITQINYLRINENPFLNTGFSHFRTHFHRKNRLSFELFAQYQYDNFRQLNPRIVVGGAPRIVILKNENFSLYGASGFFYESETWTHPFTLENLTLNLVKSTNYIFFRAKLSDNFEVNMANYYQVGYDRSIKDYRHRVNFLINSLAKITKRLSFSFSFNLQYEDKPVVPITPIIFEIRNGISVQF